MLLADRFLRCDNEWFDIATAERVTLLLRDAGPRPAQVDWADRCATLATLRHPLLLPLVDYGAASATTLFEAFAASPPVTGTSSSLSHLVRHGTRFLEAYGIALSASSAATVLRPLEISSTALRGRPVGLSLQRRTAWQAVAELIAAQLPRGAAPVRISAAPRMGLRTLRLAIARLARAGGYVPVCPESLSRWSDLGDHIAGRHVCLLLPGDAGTVQRAAVAALLARRSVEAVPPHLCLTTERAGVRSPGTIHLEPMGMKTMTSMVYLDPDYGPSEQEVFEAARLSGGAPGRFLDRLKGIPFDRPRARLFAVHESPAPYRPLGPKSEQDDGRGHRHIVPAPLSSSDPPGSNERRSRIGSVLWRAGSGAAALEARGRHAAAGRLLIRAARTLQGRRESSLAAGCWLQLAWMARTRGVLERAHEYAQQAVAVDGGVECRIQSGCLRAVCWTDAERLDEAEGALRDLVIAAATLGDGPLLRMCQLALSRVLLWTGRTEEAAAVAEAVVSTADAGIACAALTLVARSRLAAADLPGALHSARAALARLPPAAPARAVAASHRVIAEALCEVGDLPQLRLHVGRGLEAAVAGRLPLQAIRLRAVLLRGLRSGGGASAEAERIAAGIARIRRRPLPGVVERFLQRQLDAHRPAGRGPDRADRAAIPAPFETFLDLAHRAGSDHEALTGVISAVGERLGASAVVVVASDGRVCAAAGKPWRDRSKVQDEALVSGQRVMFDTTRQPPEAAEPVRCAGELLGVIACRWIAGTARDPMVVSESLRAAGLSVAAHLRSVLEQAPAPPPTVWGDLLGDSALAASLRDDIYRAARAPFPVLIEGESGSGKELVARAVHRLSPRHARRFCAINCAAISDELLEAELFGHARGAFTGALTERAGLFEEADGGTLFLDEVGELSARAQAKLLRVLQEGEVRRVGENLPRRVDVRIVAATNRRLEGEAASGRFRTDLRFRLDVLRIAVPPLRERTGDIAVLAQHFWKQAAARVGSQATLGNEALAALSRYDWPGNVRELQNAIAWMAVHAPRRGRVGAGVLPARLATAPLATGSSFELAREDFERRYVRAALAQAGGHRVMAARALGVSRQGLAKMMRRLRIEEGD